MKNNKKILKRYKPSIRLPQLPTIVVTDKSKFLKKIKHKENFIETYFEEKDGDK